MSGTDKINAANELKTFANRFKALLAVSDDLEKLGSIENAEAEAKSRLSAVQKEIEDTKAASKKAKDEHEALREKISRDLLQHKADVDHTRSNAEIEAGQIITKARADAERIRAESDVSANAVRAKMTKATEEKAQLDAEIAEKRKQLEQINRDLADVRKRIGA